MRDTIKAVLLSAFVVPGAGHFSLDRPMKGSFFLGVTMFCLYFLISPIFKISQDVSAKVVNGEIPYDVGKMTELASEQLSVVDDQKFKIAALALFVCWIISIIDSYRIGRAQEKK